MVMDRIKKGAGIIGIFAIMAACLGELSIFINVPSALLVFGLTACGLLLSDEMFNTAEYWRLARHYAISAGIIGFVTGLIQMLAHMEDPAKIGQGLAIALLTVFYGTFFGFFIARPMEDRCDY